MESDVLHMVSPYQERISARAPSEVVVSRWKQKEKTSLHILTLGENGIKKASSPRVLYNKAQVVTPRKFYSFLDITGRSSIDADYGHAPLLTRKTERGIKVAALDRAIGKGVRLPVGVFGST